MKKLIRCTEVVAGGRGMSDSDKVKLIEHVAVDVLEFSEGENEAFYRGVLTAIASICDHKEGDDG